MKPKTRTVRGLLPSVNPAQLLEGDKIEPSPDKGRPLNPKSTNLIYGPKGDIIKTVYDEYSNRGYL